jgi:glycosyltransferase involved in cell wall biosynthesis
VVRRDAADMPPSRHAIAISSLADPLDPRTWSGTPSNIASALERAGCRVVGVKTGTARAGKALMLTATRLSGLGSDWQRAPYSRAWAARRLVRHLERHPVGQVLHMGTGDMPMRRADGRAHYVFCDATWHRWAQHATDIDTYPRRMRERAADLERRAYAQTRHFFTVSDSARADLLDHYGMPADRVTTVRTGMGRVEPSVGDRDYSAGEVLFVAKERLADKGAWLLLDAFAAARRRRPDIRLTIVGSDALASRLRGTPNVEVTGFVSDADLQAVFDRSTLFAMPALNEPWGLVYLEALACRIPVLGLRRHAFPEIAAEGRFGFIVEEPTAEAVADALIEALADPARLRTMGEAGQEHCLRTYSWDHVAREIVSVLERDGAS